MHNSDPRPGTLEHARLRQIINDQDAARRARLEVLKARLDRHAQAVADLLEREAERERVAADMVGDQPVAEEPAVELVVEGHVPDPPSADDIAAASSPWSPEFAAWRRQHASKPSII